MRLRVGSDNRRGFQQVQSFARRNAFQNIRHHHVREPAIDDALGRRRAHESTAHNRNFLPHYKLLGEFDDPTRIVIPSEQREREISLSCC